MKRAVMTICIALVTFLSLYSTTIHYKADFSTEELILNVQEFGDSTATVIKWGDMQPAGEPGEYAIPSSFASFAVPCGASSVSIENVHVTKGRVQHLERPISVIQPMLDNGEKIAVDMSVVGRSYMKDRSPVTIFAKENIHDLRDVVTVKISPLTYDLRTNELQIYNSIEFDLKYNEPDALKANKSSLDHKYVLDDLAFIRAIVENPESVEDDFLDVQAKMNASSSNGVVSKGKSVFGIPSFEYCIVTNKALAPTFERFVSLKKIQGMDAGVVCMEDIIANEEFAKGDTISNINDDAGKLRRYLYFAYQNGTRFVLLGGKPPIVPIRYGRSDLSGYPYECDIPSDLYFSNVSDNWNKNGNVYYGEVYPYSTTVGLDKLDFVPQLYVGRIPCKNSLEIINYINKLEDYTFNPGNGNTHYLVRCFANFSYGLFESDEVSGWNCNEIIMPKMVEKFPKWTENYQKYEYPLGSDVMKILQEEKFGLISLSSHGSPEGVSVKYYYPKKLARYANGINALDAERVYLPDELGNGLDNLNNMHYPSILYTSACTTMPFDSPKYNGFGSYDPVYDGLTYNFGESYILGQNYGGVAFLGNTRVGFMPKSWNLEGAFYRLLAIGQSCSTCRETILSKCGVSEAFSKTRTVSPAVYDYCRLAHNLLGDPALYIWSQLPSVAGKYTVVRFKDSILINDEDSSKPRWNRHVVAIEPSGVVHKYKFDINEIRLSNIHPSSMLYFIEDNYIPVIGNGAIINTVFEKDQFFHVNNLALRFNIPGQYPSGPVLLEDGVNVKFDVKGKAWIGEGLVIKNGATLTVSVKDECYIEDVDMEANGKLVIYCDNVTKSPNFKLQKGEIVIYKYNKYYENQSEETERIYSRSMVAKSQNLPYAPMLELGKEWRYNLYHFNVYRPKEEDRECVLRIEDVVEWDGKQFYSLEQYVDGEKVDHNEWGGGYLCEDCDNRKIYFGARDYGGGMLTELLYDFADPLHTPSVNGWGENYIAIWNEYSGLDGNHNGYLFKGENSSKFENFQLVEGLGFITSTDYEKYPDAHCVGTILSGVICLAAGDCVLPKLYEVVNGKGEVIYSLETARPGYSSLNNVGRDEGGIVIGEAAIDVRSDEPIGKVSVFNSVGMVVKEVDIAETQGQISISDLVSGVYIVCTQRMNKKFTVK